jgi:hypothetical protein
MIAANLDSLLFFLLVAVAVLFQLLAKAAGKAHKEQTKRTSTPIPGTPPPTLRTPTEPDEDKIRKLLEALGQPPTSRPPAPVVPRTGIPPRPLAPVQPPMSLPQPPLFLPREERRKRKIVQKEGRAPTVTRTQEIIPPKITVAPAFEVQEGQLPIAPPPTFKTPAEGYAAATRPSGKKAELKTDIATLLASTSGLRDAMILREILGPPRGLRMLEFIGT